MVIPPGEAEETSSPGIEKGKRYHEDKVESIDTAVQGEQDGPDIDDLLSQL